MKGDLKRLKSPENIEKVKSQPCTACGRNPSEAHHIRSKGAFGGDEMENLLSLDRKCHSEVHAMGLNKFVDKYPKVGEELKKKGWVYENHRRKWIRYLD